MHGLSMRLRYFDDYDCCDRGYYGGCCYPPPCYRHGFPSYGFPGYRFPLYYDYPYYSRYY